MHPTPAVSPPPRPRLLLLEDSPVEAEALLAKLEAALPGAFDVVHVSSLAAARAELRRGGFALALVDLCVDDSRGLATFLACRESSPQLPIVVQSGLDGDSVAIEAVARGAQDYLVKGRFTVEMLRRALRYAIERSRIERELRESQERYRLALLAANDGIWDWDIANGRVTFSARFWEMLGVADRAAGDELEDWLAIVHPDERDAMAETLFSHLRGESAHFEFEHRALHADGSWRWVRARGLAVCDADGNAVRMAGSQTDVTARREAEARLLHQAHHDALTDLPNRYCFRERLEVALARSRSPRATAFAVLFLDLDRFKVVNDSLGHLAGDRLLVAVAQRLRTSLRPADLVARLGGDEFAILLGQLDPPTRAAEVASRIHRAMAAPFVIGGRQIFASVSIGIVHYGGGPETAEEILKNADIAMYRSKRTGSAGTELFDEAHRVAADSRLQVETGLRRAIAEDGLRIQYQPIVRLADGAIEGFEALVRWREPGGRLVPPADFIAVAEECGLIHDLGAWVLQAACREMVALAQRSPISRTLSVSVNVSPQQLARPGFPALVKRCLADTRLPPERLVIELTETALMENPELAAKALTDLRALGIRIHLDDFGVGYSALGYLRRFPIDCLKIDRSFVSSVPASDEDDAIVRAILALAEALGLPVVAEGIETIAQRTQLGLLRCSHGQGFLFSPPLDPDALVRAVTERRLPLRSEPPSGRALTLPQSGGDILVARS